METLQIKKEDAVKAHENASKNGKKLLENLLGKNHFIKEVTDRIKTFDDVLFELGDCDEDVIAYDNLSELKLPDYIIAHQQAVLIVKALNEGWLPDWNNSSEGKYFPWFEMGSSGFRYIDCVRWHTDSAVGSRLCLKSSKLAKYAGDQFKDIYAEFMTIK